MNPILQKMNSNPNQSMIKNLLKGNPDAVFKDMISNNPQFADFVNKNRGKSAEQIAKEYGVDISALNRLMK